MYRHGLVLGKFYPLHAGHSNLIRTALGQCDEVTVELLGASVESIPLEVRADWLREEHPTARIVAAIDDAEIDFDSAEAWDEHMVIIEELLRSPVDAVFSSDPYGEELARRLGATWVQVDPGRVVTPVSGRAIRADVEANWWALSPSVRGWLCRRVVVLGAESTGSTTLAEALAAELRTIWVPEYGRLYSEVREGGLAAPWRTDEFDLVVERQREWEEAAARTAPRPFIVCDTDALATAVWHERYVGSVSDSVVEAAEARRPDLYLLSGDDIPFVQDGMRDGEHIRHSMQERFREVLAAQPVPWLEVGGTVEQRIAQARPHITAMLATTLTFAAPLEGRRSVG